MDYLLFLVGVVLVNNMVLVYFLGLCPLMGVSSKLDASISMGGATALVMTLGTVASWLIEHYVLQPLGIGFVRILAYIVVIAGMVQFLEIVIRKSSPMLHRSLGIYLPLITSNCAVIGVPLISVREDHTLLEAGLYGFGAAMGFALIMVIFSGLRERLALATVPAAFAGVPIAFVTAGLLAMTFMGFGGLI
ncbi:electron transport complex subunit RsxA [Billgrantia endophytica]|uniref:Ion-translocating oxidoreductase complex subunit A n=1 Tax=Billgrantia endophytica TaxID=2033802 RepID=A0A2N7U008_9GAMM|nr:electron transport complex subunit RsxA [Halomonas endophytica]PMR73775.1 electron transport complex subunit RsxA [Halomonas endophytica]